MWSENESARLAFRALASAVRLRAEHRQRLAMLRALVIQSRELITELHNLKSVKGQDPRTCDNLHNHLPRIWLSKNPPQT